MLNWLVVYLPVWKIWKSVEVTIPNTVYGKIKFMFQTTNQLMMISGDNGESSGLPHYSARNHDGM